MFRQRDWTCRRFPADRKKLAVMSLSTVSGREVPGTSKPLRFHSNLELNGNDLPVEFNFESRQNDSRYRPKDRISQKGQMTPLAVMTLLRDQYPRTEKCQSRPDNFQIFGERRHYGTHDSPKRSELFLGVP
jgi:hypothetical protein